MTNEYSNFTSSFYNASGSEKGEMALGEMGKLIATEPKSVVLAIQNAGIELPLNSSPASITKTIMIHKGNKRLMQNLSAVILVNEEYDDFLKGLGKKIGGLFKKKDGGMGKSGGGLFAKIGGLFKRKKNSDGSKGTSKLGDFFRRNKGGIGDIANSLAGGLSRGGGMGGNQQGYNQGGGYQGGYQGNNQGGNNNNNNNNPKPWSMGVKIAIGGGVLVLVVGLVLVLRR
tara:strand:+ start:19840 stop:20523 length:684 start_codon:yes stop_codon:yes gene_type:complete